jgi:autotransporter translocation and assembly factor TamB
VQKLLLVTPDYGTELKSELQFSDDWPLTLSGDYWFEQEGYAHIKGKLSMSGSLEDPVADIEVLEPVNISLHGTLKDVLNQPSWQVTGRASEFSPSVINKEWPELIIGLELSSEGTLEQYQADLQSRVEGTNFRPVDVSLSLEGSTEHVSIDSGEITAEDATLSLSGEAEWSEVLRWQAILEADRLDPSIYKGMPAAGINARVTTEGEMSPEGIRYRAEIEDLDAKLAEPQLTVQGMLALEGTGEGLKLSRAKLRTDGG